MHEPSLVQWAALLLLQLLLSLLLLGTILLEHHRMLPVQLAHLVQLFLQARLFLANAQQFQGVMLGQLLPRLGQLALLRGQGLLGLAQLANLGLEELLLGSQQGVLLGQPLLIGCNSLLVLL